MLSYLKDTLAFLRRTQTSEQYCMFDSNNVAVLEALNTKTGRRTERRSRRPATLLRRLARSAQGPTDARRLADIDDAI